jgi:hypothetical protein
MNDPNAPQEDAPQEQPAPEQEAPQAPQIDINSAYEAIAQAEGWDPRLTRYEIQELKRKREEFDRERREFEAERSKQYEIPKDDTTDPYLKEMRETRRLIMEDREEKRRERDQESLRNRIAQEMNSAYSSLARQNGMTKEQMEARAGEFYENLVDLYPEPEMIKQLGSERAARAAFRNLSTNGTRPAGGVNRVNPRERVYIPSPQSGPGPGPSPAFDAASQRENETNEQYLERLTRLVREHQVGLSALPEGRKFSSG